MGVVFQARHIFLKTSHAIKIILPDLVGNDPMLVTRFRQEAMAAAAIRHQNIIAVSDFGVVRGTMPFLVMEFIQGRSLQDILAEEGAMSPARAYELMGPVCAGIAAAHRQKIVHRDLKPLNIMIQDGMSTAEGVKILDFGLAKIKSGELLGSFVQAKTSGLMGSPFYMAPEQWSDEEPDARADVYSLGVILFQMLCGEVPFKGSSIPSIMKKHLTSDPPSFSSLGVNVPPQIESVVRHALEKEAEYRTPSVEVFAEEMRDALNSVSLGQLQQSPDLDPSKTLVNVPGDPGTMAQAPGQSTSSFDPMAGTISSSQLEDNTRVLGTRQPTGKLAHETVDEEKNRIAREEIEREREARRRLVDDARKQAEEEAERKKAEEERQRKAQEEREERERKQREDLERVAQQTRELEEKLSKLATSMPPPAAGLDPEATHLAGARHAGVGAQTTPVSMSSFPHVDISLTQPPRKSSLPLVMVGVLVLVLGIGGVGGYMILKSKAPAPQPQKPANPNDPNTPTVPVANELIEIPGGTFQMGRVGATVSELPVHAVTVPAFAMDKTEVTNVEYAQFVSETAHEPPSNFAGGKPIPGQEAQPVTFVSYDDAVAFAEWRSKRDKVQYRLPTEEEWEYAARGGDQNNIYPWGNEWVEENAVIKSSGSIQPKSAGSSPNDKTRWGVLDMMGNVYEWTSSKASYYPGSTLKVEGEQRAWYVIRGASYATSQLPKPISATRRDWFSGNTKVSVLGFRLIRVK